MTDLQNHANRDGETGGASWIAVLMFFGAVAVLVFLQLFATFRGLSSPAAMDSAQLARELARGNGLHTLVVRPYAWQQQIRAGHESPLRAMTETFQPPLPALVLAPVFHAFKEHWEFPEGSRLHPLDRVVAGISLLFFLGASGMTYLTAQRVFDGWIAGWTVVTLIVSQYLWDVARSGLAPMMLLFFFAIAVYWLAVALDLQTAGEPGAGRHIVGIGLVCVLMVMTHWLAVCLVPGFFVVVMFWIRPRALAVVVVLPALLALGAWAWRNMDVSGDVLGSSKAMLQAALSMGGDSWLLRDFSGASPVVDPGFLMRKTLGNLTAQVSGLYTHLGAVLPAGLFFIALLHPFKRGETRALRWALAVLWVSCLAGMSFVGLPEEERDVNQLHVLFIPLFCAYGFAFLAVLWARLGFMHAGWWGKNALAAGALVVTALPLASTLPAEILTGLYNKGQFAHWPPYLPDRLAKIKEFTTENEVIFTDVPWALAWYADRTAIWLPMEQDQFGQMCQRISSQGETVGGLVFTPASGRSTTAGDVFLGEYRAWAPQIYRGTGVGLGIDTLGASDFPYKEFFPLAGVPAGGRFLVQMAFMSDRKRWEKPVTARP